MFRTERFISFVNPQTGLKVWYFLSREGRIGPYSSRINAQIALHSFLASRHQQGEVNRRSRVLINH